MNIRRIGIVGRAALVVAAVGMLASCGSDDGNAAQSSPAGDDITVSEARMAVPATEDGAIYLTITNAGDTDDELVGALSDITSMMHFHRSDIAESGEATMPEDDMHGGGLAVPAGDTVRLEPGARHLMAMRAAPVSVGDRFALTLLFRDAGQVVTEVEVVQVVEPS